MQHRFVLAAGLALGLVLGLAGCHKDQSATGDAAKQAMGGYAKGFNLLLKDPHDLVKSYFQTISEEGPAAGAKPHLFPSQSSAARAVKDAREAFAAAGAGAPAALAQLAPASEHAVAAADRAIAVFTEAQKYYEAENYKDDQLAKGKQLHTQMLAARKELSAAMSAFEDGLSGIEDAQAASELEDYAGDKGYSYWFRYYNIAAKKFVATVDDATKRDAAYQAISAAHTALAAFAASKGELAVGFGPYMASADTFLAACTKLTRADKGVAAETGDAGQGVISAYNGLINSGNFLYQLESTHSLK